MKKLILIPLILVACSKEPSKPSNPIGDIGCAVGKGIALGVSSEIATHLQCSKPEAIQASLVIGLQKLKVCSQAKEVTLMSVGSDICTNLASVVISGLVGGVIPSEWGCTAQDAQLKLAEVVKKACSKL